MKKIIITIIVIGVIAGVYIWLRGAQVSIGILQGEIVVSKRGDLVVPITASGKIEPASVRKIKGEASGMVEEIPFDEGEMVGKGDVIVLLDKTDEQINVDRASDGHKRAQIAKQLAEKAQKERKKYGVPLAKAKLKQATARRELQKIEYDLQKKLYGKIDEMMMSERDTSRIEYKATEAKYLDAEATMEAAAAEVEQAGIAVELAGLDIGTAEQNVATADKTLKEALERLSETKVRSPIDGMVLKRHVQVGEVVLSGKTSLTGGTMLLEVADISELYAAVNVDEADIGQVHKLAPASARPGQTGTRPAVGNPASKPAADQPTTQMVEFPEGILDKEQLVELTVESFPEDRFYGVIERISPQSEISQAIATFKVHIRITSDNRDKLVGLLNTQVEAQFTVRSMSDVVLVDYDAVHKNPDGEGYGVYIPVKKPGQAKPEPEFRLCKFGPDDAIDVAVLEGLEEGQKVYTKLPQKTRKEQREEAEEED